ncbi:SRPBCC family protein [Kaistia terrae]|uniref:SRPBCC family protein n=2 Tax=Kaistia terrae TaxID=537017 RepID=A0ABW0Q4C8_9HYPH|nr:SRPBCC family protein [Kaistia terrae]
MTERSVTHATFTIRRLYKAAPSQVFAAWASAQSKGRWFGAPDEGTTKLELDFRIGGREHSEGRGPNGQLYRYDALYQDIVPNQRIIYAYDMHLDDERISVSLATIEFRPESGGTRLVLTEHGAYLDGLDKPEYREHGTNELLDALGAVLERQAVST